MTPNDTTIPTYVVIGNDELELVRDAQCIEKVEGGTRFRQVSDHAPINPPVEFDRTGFEHPMS
jgi:hypothetical protein